MMRWRLEATTWLVVVLNPKVTGAPQRSLATAARLGKLLHPALQVRNTICAHGTLAALRLVACTQGGAEIHQRLGVIGEARVREQR